jgi:hypothetical protein
MTRRAALLGLAGLPIVDAGRALAQDSLFDSAKEMVGDFLGGGGLTDSEIAAGLREALRVGSKRVVRQVGRLDGFNADPDIHIPLPGVLKDVQETLRPLGLAGMADDLELKLNRGAEAAAPEAKALFFDAISEMTLDDVREIYDGPDDAATQYFKGKMNKPLAKRMRPIVSDSLSEVGAVRTYDDMMANYKAVPFVPDVKSDLTGYVVRKGLDGIFYYVAKEEAAIRNDPAARTTELLKKVFGAA